MVSSKTLLAAALTAGLAQAASNYKLVDIYNSTNFFNSFTFFTSPDPTHGYVRYVDAAEANTNQLAGYSRGAVYLGVDHTTIYNTTTPRPSVRVESKRTFTRGLFIADIAHMPAGKTDNASCGLWPAFWTTGANWPNDGEIDILEGVNTMSSAAITLHTGGGNCSINNDGAASSTSLFSTNCEGNIGCRQDTHGKDNYGANFNAAGGGVYVIEWTRTAIKAWFFSHSRKLPAALVSPSSASASSDITQNELDTKSLGTPVAVFAGGDTCDIAERFTANRLIINTDFCGDWAGKVWGEDETCKGLAATCEEYVAANPEAFEHAYWLINEIRVYEVAGEGDEYDGGNGNGTASAGGGGSTTKVKRGSGGVERRGRMARGLTRGFPFIG